MLTADRLALALAAACALSAALHPVAEPKQIALLALSLAAYAASRGLAGVMQERLFIVTLGAVVGVGVLLMAIAIDDHDNHGGKPLLFGFDHGAVEVAILLALLVFALACSTLRLFWIACAVTPLLAVLAAAQVRLALAALVACLILGALIARDLLRVRLGVIAAVAVVAILSGALARKSMTMEYVRYAEETLNLRPAPSAGSTEPFHVPGEMSMRIPARACPQINLNNSFDMRKQLYAEGLALLPSAGLTGIGLGKFQELSCIKAEVHNALLQTAIELGWIAGGLLVLLIVVAGTALVSPARKRPDALFALLALGYAVLISSASGRITDDIFLFVMIGYATGTTAAAESSAA